MPASDVVVGPGFSYSDLVERAMGDDTLRIAVLGPLEVRRGNTAVALPQSKKARAILAYLAVTGRPHTRAQLCDLFWDVADDPRGGLRWTLSRLRKATAGEDGDVVVADRTTVQVDDSRADTDMLTIRRRVANPGELTVEELETMAAQFRGELLEGLDLEDLHAVQAWLIAQRGEARKLQVDVLRALVDRLADEPDRATRHVRALIQVEPHVDEWHAKHVELLVAAGRQREAEEQYKAGVRELEANGSATHGLRMTWRRLSGATARQAPRTAGPLGAVGGSPFVGRDEELALLDARVDRAIAGHGGTLTVAGEPGIGKSRLIHELASRASTRGVAVLEGTCASTAYALPYLPFIEALDEVATSLPEDAIVEQIPLLARVLPGLAQQRGIAADAAGGEDVDRYAVFRAVAALLEHIAGDRGLVLLLEDLHWADTQSLLMVAYLARLLTNTRVLLVATYRDVEVSRTHPLRDTLTALRREPMHARVALRKLDEAAARALIAELTHAPDATVRAILDQTEGHPLFIEEVVKHLIEEGRFDSLADEHLDADSITALGLPEGVRDVIGRRLSRMSEACNRMLAHASALVGEIRWPVLAAVCGGDEDELLDLLDEALAAQLVRERPGVREGSYEFTHALIRQSLYEELSTSRRTRLHRKIGDAIERVYATNLDVHLSELAHHYFEAAPTGQLAKFLDYTLRAGERAMTLMAFEEAGALYERALATLDELDGDEHRDVRGTLHRRYARALATMSRWSDAGTQYERALAHVGDHGEDRARLLLHASVSSFWNLDVDGVAKNAAEALELARAAGDDTLTAAANGLLAQAAMARGDVRGGAQRYDAARAQTGGIDDLLVAQAIQQYPIALYWAGKFDACHAEGKELLKVARAKSDGSMVMNLLAVTGMARGCAGRYRESELLFREAERFGRDHGILRLLARSTCMQIGCAIDLGAIDLAYERAQGGLEAASSTGFAPSIVSTQIDLLLIAIARGDVAAAEELLPVVDAAREDTKGFHAWVWSMRIALARAQLALVVGDDDTAARTAQSVIGDADRTGRVKYQIAALRVLAQTHARAGRDEQAANVLRSAATAAQSIHYPALLVQVVGDLVDIGDASDLLGPANAAAAAIASELDNPAMLAAFEQSAAVTRIRQAVS